MKAVLLRVPGSSSALRWLVFACPPRALDPRALHLVVFRESPRAALLGRGRATLLQDRFQTSYTSCVLGDLPPPHCYPINATFFCARGCDVHHTNVDW